MSKKMLIDATHKEETRVAVIDGNKLAEYDYENQGRKPLKGNVYLAKVTRVEPSLQAAFVNFGGNRHGFLPFSEIHPDYFRIPVSDREALMAEQEALIEEHDALESAEEELEEESDSSDALNDETIEADDTTEDTAETEEDDQDNDTPEEKEEGENAAPSEENEQSTDDGIKADANTDDKKTDDKPKERNHRGRGRGRGGRGRGRGGRAQNRNENVEVVGGGDEMDMERRFRFNLRRKYKIQEVIKRGQIMLVQVNKEERGNKGAAVGSYLSLPGRYCVLMPNSPRAGGVSRKIANHKDRARMREIVKDLEVPKGMSVIVRTAGVTRTKTEIKRDLDYLMRLWTNIRDLTLQSTAPALIYEEADLIKRSVRDLYTRDIDEIIVSGENGHKNAKDFMKMLIPSHVKKVKQYDATELPLFHRYQIENQINEIGQVEVRLRSGGYLVINPTEALISIDVNSGKATKGRHIEETALKTNLEAASEIARQLRLRDLGGLVVVDFIDMEDRRNNGKVERRMKESLSTDRARVQVGRISSFGLMELSRQRLSPSLTEAQYETCQKCNGLGLIRTADAMSIIVLRAIEEEGIRRRAKEVIVHVSSDVALYILNYKRHKLMEIETRYNLKVLLRIDDEMGASECRVEVSKPISKDDINAEEGNDTKKAEPKASQPEKDGNESDAPKKRRGRRGGAGRNQNKKDSNDVSNTKSDKKDDDTTSIDANSKPSDDTTPNDTDKVDTQKKTKKDKPKRAAPKAKAEKVEDSAAAEKALETAPKKKDLEKKPAEKTAQKSTKSAKKEASKKDGKKPEPKLDESTYQTVNEAPKEKKKGWWNRLVE